MHLSARRDIDRPMKKYINEYRKIIKKIIQLISIKIIKIIIIKSNRLIISLKSLKKTFIRIMLVCMNV